ncbi:DUF2808 domain-containing protein [Synechococcus sp. HB1133]|nr:DUF2808 domain-containing protein [Synechococcus sp. PH41509]MCB4423240.1 DUF2808 domain-containing protein [Synechococcus sp. HB1133]MCB4430726.1 DUF2808 domain-containing protein [Synechococcus sp. HBA1120]NHI82188.1 DUF2808 domain-containing protein [Synechococcus sp. HB1133]
MAMLLLAPMLLLEVPSLAQSLFDRPPTRVMIHNPEATEGLRNRTTITVVVPEDAGNTLRSIVLRQLPNIDQWDWGQSEPRVYFGDYSLRGKGATGLASAVVSDSEGVLNIQLTPAVQPGQTVNVVFRGFNPDSSIYQWSTELLADGEDPVRYVGPTLRSNVYEQDPFR